MIERPQYLDKLISWKDKDLIKIVTGIRRCGKSTLFELYRKYLISQGIENNQIQTINLEDVKNAFTDGYDLHKHIEKNLIVGKRNYIFLDEIQQIENAQRMLASLRLREGIDIYVTGSNAYMLSNKLATFIAGRYIEIKMYPLSFKEYASAFNGLNTDEMFQQYLTNSGFPQVLEFGGNMQLIQDYIEGIYRVIVQKDIAFHNGIKDISRFDSVAKFIFDNIGSETSIKNISNAMTSGGRKIHPQTIESYLDGFIECFALYRADRYDIKGKQYLMTNAKYYLADIGLRYAVLGNKGADDGHILENIVCVELLRRGYKVYVGKIGANEVDFVAVQYGKIEYYQVSLSVLDENILARELKPLKDIRDSYPKFLLTRDYNNADYDGIKQMNVLDWLLGRA
jgi:predicted AAA+ superfamily ATPase